MFNTNKKCCLAFTQRFIFFKCFTRAITQVFFNKSIFRGNFYEYSGDITNVKLKPCSCDDLEFRSIIHRNSKVLIWQSQTKKEHLQHFIEASKNAHIYNSINLFRLFLQWIMFLKQGLQPLESFLINRAFIKLNTFFKLRVSFCFI